MDAAGHRLAQLRIRAQAIRDAYGLWSLYRTGNLDSWTTMLAVAQPVVAHRYGLSSHLGSLYFRQATGETATLAPTLPEEMVAASLAATGLVGTIRSLSAGFSPEAARQVGFVRFSGGLSRLVLKGGRDTVVQSAQQRGMAWQRVTGDSPCEFCLMLADRGSVFSEESADFPAHDHCSCSAEPVT